MHCNVIQVWFLPPVVWHTVTTFTSLLQLTWCHLWSLTPAHTHLSPPPPAGSPEPQLVRENVVLSSHLKVFPLFLRYSQYADLCIMRNKLTELCHTISVQNTYWRNRTNLTENPCQHILAEQKIKYLNYIKSNIESLLLVLFQIWSEANDRRPYMEYN